MSWRFAANELREISQSVGESVCGRSVSGGVSEIRSSYWRTTDWRACLSSVRCLELCDLPQVGGVLQGVGGYHRSQ